MKLEIKIGARVVMVYNVDTPDGLVNGEMGTVIDIVKTKEGDDVEYIVVQFDLEETGDRLRRKHPLIASRYQKQNGTPIFRQMTEYQVGKAKKLSCTKAKLWQFPLRLAWASTGHKMQVRKKPLYMVDQYTNSDCFVFRVKQFAQAVS